MNRRDAIKATVVGGMMMLGQSRALAKVYYPSQVDQKLWKGINRVENPGEETDLEKLHSPVIEAPDKVKVGEAFPVEVTVGRLPHPMVPAHWIEHVQLNIGNEPVGTVIFQSHGYVKAATKFSVALDHESKGKTVSLIVEIKCNLHGIWQNHANVKVA